MLDIGCYGSCLSNHLCDMSTTYFEDHEKCDELVAMWEMQH